MTRRVRDVPRRSVSGVLVLGVLAALLLAAASTDDPYLDQQWWLGSTGAPAGSGAGQPVELGAGQVVAVVDSGVDLDHPDLVDRFLRDPAGEVVGIDLVDGGPPTDSLGHGTMVAGIVAATADNGIGVAGMVPAASLLPVRVLDDEGTGTATRVAEGITWALANGATVVNVSLEASDGDGTAMLDAPLVVTALAAARSEGVPVVVAAGNRAAALDVGAAAVLVGAHDRAGRLLEGSGRGPTVLHAPGLDMVSTWCRGAPPACSDGPATYGVGVGTSFAAPVVTGMLARELARGRDAAAAEAAVRAGAVPIGDGEDGALVGLLSETVGTDVADPPDVTVGPATGIGEVTAAEPTRDHSLVVVVAIGVVVLAVGLDRGARRRS